MSGLVFLFFVDGCFLVTALLKYNPHTLQFTHLVYNSVVCSVFRVAYHLTVILEKLHHPKKKPHNSLRNYSLFLLFPRQRLI